MNHLNRQHGQVLMIIFASLFLGGGIATGVFSSGKSIKSLQKTARSMTQRSLKSHTRALLDLIGNQGSTQAQFDELLLRHRAALLEAENELLPLRDELRSTLDQQEWARLFR
jgi:uncharacterized protein YneF (UPF0154 family)